MSSSVAELLAVNVLSSTMAGGVSSVLGYETAISAQTCLTMAGVIAPTVLSGIVLLISATIAAAVWTLPVVMDQYGS